jgi:repressor LexA
MGELSDRQAAILDFVSSHCSNYGYPPTVREIGLAVGLASPSTVHGHLAKLEALGYIRRHATKPRAMLVHSRGRGAEAPASVSGALPLIGAVAAGLPRLAQEDVEDWVPVPFRGDFVLRVTGDSMIGAGILDGDMVVVRRQQSADDGEIVVALVDDGEATVKRLRRADGRVVLHAENVAYAPIVADDVRILGKVVGLVRGIS